MGWWAVVTVAIAAAPFGYLVLRAIRATTGKDPGVVSRSGAKLKIRIHYAEKPDEFGVTAWRTVTKQGYGEGKARRMDVTLKPVQRNGVTRAWNAVFRLRGERHYYMDAFGAWDAGDASWKFHARTVKT